LSPPEPAGAIPLREPEPEPGAQFLAEIREQPAALAALLDHDREIARIAAAARARGPAFVRMVGHGSSDNATSYGVYALGLLARWPAMRDSITLTVHYGTDFDMSGTTAIALSQSGRTPDVVEYLARARRRGAFTVALTNDPTSELAAEAEAVIPLAAGAERAVAATKTYLTELAALALLAGHAAGEGRRIANGVLAVAELLDELIPPLAARIASVALPFAYVGRMFLIGRGAEFATAREIALKLLETCRIAAQPLTATDLAHGPMAAVDSLFPVWTIASDDAALPAVVEAAERVRAAGGTLIASGDAAHRIEHADYVLATPPPPSPLLAPLLSVVPGQLFAWALARAKGLDADRPRGLSKITFAQ
jgi:glucosamine--fructose-6-phosphate aminotransferase (isomerizing)